jgi:adenylate cyclase
MGIETERKFLVRSDAWKAEVHSSQRFRQGYLNRETRCSVRVRSDGAKGWLNIKSVTVGASRSEYEYVIPLHEADELLDTLCLQPLIEKVRHYVEAGKHVWEIDVFEGDNQGLIVAEIELDDPDESFLRPAWLGEEVTEDVRYYNTSLSSMPFRHWS